MTNRKPRPANRSSLKDGQECVWDYPRPPALEPVKESIRIILGRQMIAETSSALRVLETSHPPTVYIPVSDIVVSVLRTADRQTFCEWKGVAKYYHVVTEDSRVEFAGWYYPKPNRRFAQLEKHVAFYPSRMSECYWGDELVRAQPGDFYGGWITSKIVGPFKGDAGTGHW